MEGAADFEGDMPDGLDLSEMDPEQLEAFQSMAQTFIQPYIEDKEKLEEEIGFLEDELHDVKEEFSDLQNQYNSLIDHGSKLEQQLEMSNSEQDQLNSQLQMAETKSVQYEKEVQNLTLELQTTSSETQRL